jgi:CheY-like chemotaxis protein
MRKSILVLEDNTDRREEMHKWASDRLGMYELLMTDDPGEMIHAIRTREQRVLVVSLDHDLHERPDHNTELTGMMVVDFPLTQPPTFPILLHTSNNHDWERMRFRLTDARWAVDWVKPFDGVSWISTDWYHSLKRAIRKTARPVPAGSILSDEE